MVCSHGEQLAVRPATDVVAAVMGLVCVVTISLKANVGQHA